MDVWITGALTVDSVGDVARQFRVVLAFNRFLRIHVDEVTSFDLNGMQLCLALRRDATARNTGVEFVGEKMPERFRRMLAFAGLPEL